VSKLKDGKPTGRLNNDGTMAEIECYEEHPSGFFTRCGTRWVPVTEEMRKHMNGSVVSMVHVSPEMLTDLRNALADAADPPMQITPVTDEDLRTSEYVSAQIAGSLRGSSETASVDISAASPAPLTPDTSLNLTPVFHKGIHTPAEPASTCAADLKETERGYTGFVVGHSMTFRDPEPTKMEPNSNTWDDSEALTKVGDDRQPERRQVKEENSGGNVNYYSVPIKNPKRPERQPYIFEVEDLIQALNLGFHEGTVLKSLVRSAVERELGLAKKGGDAIRDAEKMVHSSQEHLRALKLRRSNA
jgi:hypothetical protein